MDNQDSVVLLGLDEENQCVEVATMSMVCLGPLGCCSGYSSRLRTSNVLLWLQL